MVQVLHRLPKATHLDLLVGAEHFDDAGVYRINDRTAIVQSVDFFPPLVDDPYAFGRIAAANSLSDLYAMGATALTAMNIVGFPDKEVPTDVLVEILRGGAERVQHAGAVIIGGHTVRDAEIKYGLAVTGVVHPDRFVTNGGARPGDILVLTKPLGTGVLTSAFKMGKLPESDLAEAVESMCALNRAAAMAMMEHGVRGATDVTGFGLLGHAFEMAEASRVTLEIDAKTVPMLPESLRFAEQDIFTRAAQATLEHLGSALDPGPVGRVMQKVLADAQTSGGLLVSVVADQADSLVSDMRGRGVSAVAVIGEVQARSGPAIRLR